MSEGPKLKLVKTNPREVETQVPANRYSSRYVTKKETVHDHEMHDEDGMPVFKVNMNSGYSRENKHSFEWHPAMKDMHPDLERSFEHGSRHFNRQRMTAGSKDGLIFNAQQIYHEAMRKGFKDSIPHTTEATPMKDSPHAHITHFHDPETGEKVLSSPSTYGARATYHKSYLDTHGIDPQAVTSAKQPSHYELAKHIISQKGQQRSAYGSHSSAAKGSGDYHKSYTAAAGKTDEEVSSAHEAHLRDIFKKSGSEATIVRHSPTMFSAHVPARGEYNPHITHMSLAHEGKLTHTTTEGPKPYSDKFSHNF